MAATTAIRLVLISRSSQTGRRYAFLQRGRQAAQPPHLQHALRIRPEPPFLTGLAVSRDARHEIDLQTVTRSGDLHDAGAGDDGQAVVQALAWGTLRDSEDLEDLRGSLFPRLSALATAQDVLLNIPQGSTMVRNLVTAAVRPFLPDPRITVHCKEDVAVPASYAHGLTLALFELATNSAKYGALSASTGSIVISCERRDEEVVLQWVETSTKVGPNQSASLASESFGRKLIKAALRNDRGTDVSYECSAGSVMANFRWPSHVAH